MQDDSNKHDNPDYNPIYDHERNLELMKSRIHEQEIRQYIINLTYDGMFLKKVPIVMRTYEMCHIAVKQNACAIEFVPSQFKTIPLCTEVLQNAPHMERFVPAPILAKIKSACSK